MWLLASEVSVDCYTRPPGIVSLLMFTFTYILTGNDLIYIHTRGKFNNHTACCLFGIMVTTTSVMDVMKMGNVVPFKMASYHQTIIKEDISQLVIQLQLWYESKPM